MTQKINKRRACLTIVFSAFTLFATTGCLSSETWQDIAADAATSVADAVLDLVVISQLENALAPAAG